MGKYGTKDWARLAMKFGLLVTDAKLWSSINNQFREKAEDMGDVFRHKFETAADRLDKGRSALQGRNDWVVPVASFVGGVGVGLGLGILFTPISGREAREALRDRAVGVKNKVTDLASATRERATGAERSYKSG
jgi:hypothetical protein